MAPDGEGAWTPDLQNKRVGDVVDSGGVTISTGAAFGVALGLLFGGVHTLASSTLASSTKE
jgi:hypothetical protein